MVVVVLGLLGCFVPDDSIGEIKYKGRFPFRNERLLNKLITSGQCS